MKGLRISEAAREARVNVETLRYYERRGLVPEPPRSGANYRVYPPETVRLVRFVKRAQELGFTLEEIRELLDFRDNTEASCHEVRERARAKIRDIGQKIGSLESMRRVLTGLAEQCSGSGPVTACPILESLEPENDQ